MRRGCGITDSQGRNINLAADLSVIEGEYLRDILSQPQALENTLGTLGRSKELLRSGLASA